MCDLGLQIEKLNIQPGDILNISSQQRLSSEQIENIKKTVEEAFIRYKIAVPVLLFMDGLDASVERKQ